jgi:hypothetical protein
MPGCRCPRASTGAAVAARSAPCAGVAAVGSGGGADAVAQRLGVAGAQARHAEGRAFVAGREHHQRGEAEQPLQRSAHEVDVLHALDRHRALFDEQDAVAQQQQVAEVGVAPARVGQGRHRACQQQQAGEAAEQQVFPVGGPSLPVFGQQRPTDEPRQRTDDARRQQVAEDPVADDAALEAFVGRRGGGRFHGCSVPGRRRRRNDGVRAVAAAPPARIAAELAPAAASA